MGITHGFAGTVGNTPLIRLRGVSEETGCEILGKAEFMNPGGSVKDRAARAIVADAEARGELRAGGSWSKARPATPASALRMSAMSAAIAASSSCRTTSRRKSIACWKCSAPNSTRCPRVPYSNPNQYQKVSQRLAGSLRNAIWANQFDNPINRHAHLTTTGPEIWEQTNGKVDAFVAASGTGGTLAGTSEYLKSRNRGVRCVLADPPGSSLYEFVRNGALKSTGSGSITEGIGIARITVNFKDAPLDDAVHVEDADTVRHVYRLLHEEGLFVGSTSGINVAAAVRVARDLGPGHTIVTVLCDGGAKYQSRLFNREWLAKQGSGGTGRSSPQRRAHTSGECPCRLIDPNWPSSQTWSSSVPAPAACSRYLNWACWA